MDPKLLKQLQEDGIVTLHSYLRLFYVAELMLLVRLLSTMILFLMLLKAYDPGLSSYLSIALL